VVVTGGRETPTLSGDDKRLVHGLSPFPVHLQSLKELAPDVIVTSPAEDDVDGFTRWGEGALTRALGKPSKLLTVKPLTVDALFTAWGELGASLGRGREGRDLAQRAKSQILDWARNFYERLRHKKVTVISNLDPVEVGGRWVPHLIKTLSGKPQVIDIPELSARSSWSEIAAFAPDVILVAPVGASLEESVKFLKPMEAIEQWEKIPAVKRGEVIFMSGRQLYGPGPGMVRAVACVVSGMAGLDSGYITKRDELYRLRFVELHRHRFM
jgi:ABC-type Fe3+-hydroxamate transport system substrate-binding protein